ncbi:MAG: adenylate/guanylate cyclase domain-containing protein [Sphingobacteriales bacterium]|nr:MAG: adenylate/guanylate cyclase domain-containing protein [Sphingobacteriales bacterium]
MGALYMLEHDYDKAIEIQTRAAKLAKDLDLKSDWVIALIGLGKSFVAKKDLNKGAEKLLEAEPLANEVDAKYSLLEIYKGLSEIYSKKNDFKTTAKYQSLLLAVKDSIYNLETDKKLGTLQFTFDLDKQKNQINLLTKDQEIKDQEIARQKLVRNGFVGGFAVVLVFAGIFFRQRNKIKEGKKRSDELLLNILPEETAEELKQTGTAKAKKFDMVSVMFTDFKNFTQASELLIPEELVKEIDTFFSAFDSIITKYGIEKTNTIGNTFLCASGLPVEKASHAEDIIKAGLEMQAYIEKNKKEKQAQNKIYFELRLGIHSGPVVAGVVGTKKFAYDIWGDAVNTASRMVSRGEIGKVNISGSTYELVKDKFNCVHRGKIQAKNKGEIDMYFVN